MKISESWDFGIFQAKEVGMSLGKTWFTPEAAEDKYGVSKAQILAWVDKGLVRCEREGNRVVRVNIDDVDLEVQALSKKS